MIRPPPISPLFPYPPLFRSRARPSHDARALRRAHARDRSAPPRRAAPLALRAASEGARCSGARPREHPRDEAEDRKSTRLNSSHLVISYAVFCLKKKKEIHSGICPTVVHKFNRSNFPHHRTSSRCLHSLPLQKCLPDRASACLCAVTRVSSNRHL